MNDADEAVRRPLVDVHRRVDLLDDAVVHEHDPLAERHRFDLVVRDVDDRRLEPLVEPGDFGPHLHAELGVEIRQRLVEQKHLRLADDRPAERDALPLAAGELARSAVEQRFDREDLGRFADAAFDLRPRRAAHLQAERHVLLHRHVRVEGVVLEHHGDVAVAGRDVVHEPVADVDLAAGDFLEPGDHPQRRRFAAARRADQHDELAVGDLED